MKLLKKLEAGVGCRVGTEAPAEASWRYLEGEVGEFGSSVGVIRIELQNLRCPSTNSHSTPRPGSTRIKESNQRIESTRMCVCTSTKKSTKKRVVISVAGPPYTRAQPRGASRSCRAHSPDSTASTPARRTITQTNINKTSGKSNQEEDQSIKRAAEKK
eukprot:3874196-Rhodomonas_salina.2